jgi:uncharacterized protein YjbI with pentapeptide repeats
MRTVSKEELQEILEKHKMWLVDREGGEKANLSNAVLTNVDLHAANLGKANLSKADLSRANLHGAGLCEANLSGASLIYSDLSHADLCKANLSGANLSGCDLSWAILYRANLREANLQFAQLIRANLREANLRGADLDFSVLPLRCGGLKWKIDKKFAIQIAYHFCSMQCDDEEFISLRNTMLDFANKFHRIDECRRLKPIATKS